MTRLGYQIPSFTYPGTPNHGVFDLVVQQAKEADASGFDRVLVMDHFYQLPMIGEPDEAMFECYTILAALAQHTSNVRLSALVTGNTYRNPALLAKIITTLDHVSHGRATLGIGAGWFELEHAALGFEFGTFTDRFEKLEEALQIIIPMLRGDRATLSGKHYSAVDAVNSPPAVSRIPIMIGGSGEKKTLRMVAQYADESNLTCPVNEVGRKLEALAEHCQQLGRDRSEITVSKQMNTCIAPTVEEAEADLLAMAAHKGWSAQRIEMTKSLIAFGNPDMVAEHFQAVMDTGVDGITMNSPVNGHIPGRVALLGETASRVLG